MLICLYLTQLRCICTFDLVTPWLAAEYSHRDSTICKYFVCDITVNFLNVRGLAILLCIYKWISVRLLNIREIYP